MIDNSKIKLGDQEFAIGPMNLGQLERAMPLLAGLRSTPGAELGGLIDLVQIALSDDHPEIDLRKLDATLPQLQAAVTAVLVASGFEVENSRLRVRQVGEPSAKRSRKPGARHG